MDNMISTNEVKPLTVDQWLNLVDYKELQTYKATEFAHMFVNYIKLINDGTGDENKTPVAHYKMLDGLTTNKKRLANLCARGFAKTTLFGEYLIPILALTNELPNLGEVTGIIYVSDSIDNGVKSMRKNLQARYENSEFLKKFLPEAKFTDKYIEFTNTLGKKLGVKLLGASTGIRGTKVFGKRPNLAILDDLLSDADSRSPTLIQSIKDTIHEGIMYALHPKMFKIIFNGTPFNKNDPLYEVVESGAWEVNVYPICDRFPCARHEFAGGWEDRFDYDYVLDMYEAAVKSHVKQSFYQELMLRITSDDERLIPNSDIQWYSRDTLIEHLDSYNIYLTTDFAFTERQSADYCVFSVWAVNHNRDFFWIDGFCERILSNEIMDRLFYYARKYPKIQSVGLEVSGQQGALVPLIEERQVRESTFFNIALDVTNKNRSDQKGIRPTTDKFSRFGLVVPYFRNKKIYFPKELKNSIPMMEMLEEVQGAMRDGFKSKHDDFLDSISMLASMYIFAPTVKAPPLDGVGGRHFMPELNYVFKEDKNSLVRQGSDQRRYSKPNSLITNRKRSYIC